MQLVELQKNVARFTEAGAEVWSISPDAAEPLTATREALGLSFPTLMDPDSATIVRYGILNEKAGKIPHPTSLVVDAAGVVRYKRVDVNYMQRPTSADLLAALAALAKPAP